MQKNFKSYIICDYTTIIIVFLKKKILSAKILHRDTKEMYRLRNKLVFMFINARLNFGQASTHISHT